MTIRHYKDLKGLKKQSLRDTSLLSGLEDESFFYIVSAGDPKTSAGQAELLTLFDTDGAAYR